MSNSKHLKRNGIRLRRGVLTFVERQQEGVGAFSVHDVLAVAGSEVGSLGR